jgi:hypothetical protein
MKGMKNMPHQSVLTPLSFVEAVLWFLVGMIFSVIVPVAIKTVQKKAGLEAIGEPSPTLGQRIATAWKRYGGNRYLKFLIAASIVALFLVLILQFQFYTLLDAIVAGVGWESFVNKLSTSQQGQQT